MDKLAKADVLVELSWEVCNKVGGINAVLESKAVLMKQYYPNYFCVGPYVEDNLLHTFIERSAPAKLQGILDGLKNEGVTCHFGTWRIKGEPDCILIENSLLNKKDMIKTLLWEKFGVESLGARWDFEEPLLWSWACSLLLERLQPLFGVMVSHHHEWMAGLSILALKARGIPIHTVFTTHATMLGRSVAGHGEDLFAQLEKIDPDTKAKEIGVVEKFTAERACARECSVFTTVSEITAVETEKILGRKPDVLTLNGLDIARFPTIEETSIKHVTSRERLREFQTYFFFPYQSFDVQNNLMMCISGRYEFLNKGVDVFVEALARLNEQLKKDESKRTVTAFFWIPGAQNGIRPEVRENKNYYKHIRGYVQWHSKEILQRTIHHFITCEDPSEEGPYTKEFMNKMRGEVLHFRRSGNPPISTHIVSEQDAIYSALQRSGLDNHADDKVKVVLYPIYLNGQDDLLNLSYYDALAGCHFSVFPSAYEPWGYTPMESAALAVPTLTTDLAGFGRFIKPKLFGKYPGITVLERNGKPHEEVVEMLFSKLYEFVRLDHAERVQHKINAKQVSQLADWAHLIKRYIKAHNMALDKPL